MSGYEVRCNVLFSTKHIIDARLLLTVRLARLLYRIQVAAKQEVVFRASATE